METSSTSNYDFLIKFYLDQIRLGLTNYDIGPLIDPTTASTPEATNAYRKILDELAETHGDGLGPRSAEEWERHLTDSAQAETSSASHDGATTMGGVACKSTDL